MKAKSKYLSVLVMIVLAVTLFAPNNALAASTITVKPTDMDGWAFAQETANGTGSLVAGPATPPMNSGSARFTLDATGRELLGTLAYAGTRLDGITNLQYSTYRSSFDPGNLLAVTLQFDVDYDITDANTVWQGRLVFEPYFTAGSGNIPEDTWQTWTPLTGMWWASGAPGNAVCPQASPCTWAAVLTAFPNAGLRVGVGFLQFKAGGPWAGFDGNVDAFTIEADGTETTYDFEPLFSACPANIDIPNTTITLLANCTTDETIFVPDGWTLDGDGYTITAVDPTGGHFLGALIQNAGSSAHVTNLTVTVSGLANVCDGGDDRLRGILFDGAEGSITNNTVVDINQGMSGCQEGNGIEVRNEPFDNSGNDLSVIISGNTVTNYQKNGITANGSVAATITDNFVTGAGPVNYIAQNGIQIGFGGTAIIKNNSVSGNNYTPDSYVACGVLYFDAAGVKASTNTRFGNERDQCNFGKGGGAYNPSP